VKKLLKLLRLVEKVEVKLLARELLDEVLLFAEIGVWVESIKVCLRRSTAPGSISMKSS
jgi:hypothetical protein